MARFRPCGHDVIGLFVRPYDKMLDLVVWEGYDSMPWSLRPLFMSRRRRKARLGTVPFVVEALTAG